MMNYIYKIGTLTVKCFVHAEKNEVGEIVRYHGNKHVATVKDVHQDDILQILNEVIEKYLSKCTFKNCERTFSWKFETK